MWTVKINWAPGLLILVMTFIAASSAPVLVPAARAIRTGSLA